MKFLTTFGLSFLLFLQLTQEARAINNNDRFQFGRIIPIENNNQIQQTTQQQSKPYVTEDDSQSDSDSSQDQQNLSIYSSLDSQDNKSQKNNSFYLNKSIEAEFIKNQVQSGSYFRLTKEKNQFLHSLITPVSGQQQKQMIDDQYNKQKHPVLQKNLQADKILNNQNNQNASENFQEVNLGNTKSENQKPSLKNNQQNQNSVNIVAEVETSQNQNQIQKSQKKQEKINKNQKNKIIQAKNKIMKPSKQQRINQAKNKFSKWRQNLIPLQSEDPNLKKQYQNFINNYEKNLLNQALQEQ